MITQPKENQSAIYHVQFTTMEQLEAEIFGK